jgi:GMP synthase-like glutamine amidotransferase
MIKVYSRNIHDASWLGEIEQVSDMKDADILILPGGGDIHPSFYGEVTGRHTYCYKDTDANQFDLANQAFENKVLMVGICRGAQLLTVFAGGKLIQHVDSHHFHHKIITSNNDIYSVNSIHHQMMFPFELPSSKFNIIAKTHKAQSSTYLNGSDEEINVGFYSRFCEPEIVWYPEIRGLAIQSHPEGYRMPTETIEYMKTLVEKYRKHE